MLKLHDKVVELQHKVKEETTKREGEMGSFNKVSSSNSNTNKKKMCVYVLICFNIDRERERRVVRGGPSSLLCRNRSIKLPTD